MLLVSMVSVLLCVTTAQPAMDACQLVNTTQPAECPKTIGPPCPPCVLNSASSYQSGDPLTITASTRSSIVTYMNDYLDYWLAHYPPTECIPLKDPTSIVEGATGRALIFLRMYNYSRNASFLQLAVQYLDNTFRHIDSAQTSASYFVGYSGIYIVAAQIAEFQNDEAKKQQYLAHLTDVFVDVDNAISAGDQVSPQYGVDLLDGNVMTGLSGLLYSSMLANEFFGKGTVDNGYITRLAHYIITMGLETSAPYHKNYVLYKFSYEQGCFLPGSAEGNGGAIRMLLEAYRRGYVPDLMTNQTFYNAITNTLNWFADIQFKDGNIPTYSDDSFGKTCASVYGSDADARVQWCHGAPGFIDTMSLASVVYNELKKDTLASTYLQSALMAYNSTWERGLLIKGLMHCHGIAGNAYTLMHINKNLKLIPTTSALYQQYDIPFLMNQSLWRGIQFVEFTIVQENINVLRTEYSNEDYSAWLGSYGITWLYIQSVQLGWPANVPVCMMGWDFCGI